MRGSEGHFDSPVAETCSRKDNDLTMPISDLVRIDIIVIAVDPI